METIADLRIASTVASLVTSLETAEPAEDQDPDQMSKLRFLTHSDIVAEEEEMITEEEATAEIAEEEMTLDQEETPETERETTLEIVEEEDLLLMTTEEDQVQDPLFVSLFLIDLLHYFEEDN